MSELNAGIDHNELVTLVRDAAHNVFETMLGQSIVAGDAYLDTVASPAGNGIVSFIGLAGAWMGTGSIACSANCACRIASQLMMADYPAVDDDVLDAVAEVTNMIIGNVKTALEERLGPMGLSIPTVIYGRNFSSRTVGKQEWTVVPFDYEGERLEVQLCLAEHKGSGRPRIAVSELAAAVHI
jgi:chemotaxis protein CheX